LPRRLILSATCLALISACSTSFIGPLYLNPNASFNDRVEDLVGRMTLEEKISQLKYNAPAIPRLNIPEYNWWNECLHGVARAGRATVFPQAIGLASMWDETMMYRVATAISDEARAKHHAFARQGKRSIYQGLTFWTPNINLFRDPRWGRGMETYGEDPYLAGRLAVRFVKGLQGDHPRYLKTVATLKHFAVHSGPEPDRHVFDANVSERDLHQSYLPHFRMGIVEGGAASVMCAYNRFRGEPCCGSSPLLQSVLRDSWGFKGYVVSDCWALSDFHDFHKVTSDAPQSAAMALKAGTDLNCGTVYRHAREAIDTALVDSAFVDTAVRRLMKARFQLGMFDPPGSVPFAQIPYAMNDCQAHRQLALEAAQKSIVLLKNDGVLPLSNRIQSLAVIGPNADNLESLLANYNGVPTDPVTPLRGIREAVGPCVTVTYARGCDLAEGMPHMEAVPSSVLRCTIDGKSQFGLSAQFFDNRDLKGEAVAARIDTTVDFYWWDKAPLTGLDADDFGVVWTGELIPPASGDYYLGGWGASFRLFVDDSLWVTNRNEHEAGHRYRRIALVKDQPVKLRLEFFEEGGDAEMTLCWAPPQPNLLDEAVAAAEASDVVVLVLGLSPRLEGEALGTDIEGFSGGDRLSLQLPRVQRRLMKAIHATGKPVVLVLMSGGALGVTWADAHLPAILQAGYGGQAAGTAIGQVLFGHYNPAGRLPVTYYRSIGQVPYFSDYSMKNRTYRFFQGEPLYAFGHGLSYTTFSYGRLELPETVSVGQTVTVSVTVTNTGPCDGEEVVQLYLSHRDAAAPVPIRSLQGFHRIPLKKGQSRRITFELTPRQFALFSREDEWKVEPGSYRFFVGGGQPTQSPGVTGEVVLTGRPTGLPL